nr:D-serine ammonia-lyase [Metabacillus lacus]
MLNTHPIEKLKTLEEFFWINPRLEKAEVAFSYSPLGKEAVLDAESRLRKFSPYIAEIFPETKEAGGIIESPLVEISSMKKTLEKLYEMNIRGSLLLKQDNALPISGSIKARGGIYEVLKYAETLAISHGLLKAGDDYLILKEKKCRDLFSRHSIVVGSTGNLGLSIGIISAALGFSAVVHMSSDARQWKKSLLRRKGVTVVEHEGDYSIAVETGRREAEENDSSHFIDDEHSVDLFLGYSTAAVRLQKQLKQMNIHVDRDHPLFVYLPCGVGGGPGGVAFGLKLAFGDDVHCFFAEPTHSPSMLLGLATQKHEKISISDIGLDNITAADGLAVGRPSGFVGELMSPFLAGCYTVKDSTLFYLLKHLADTENLYLEPSALAGMAGPAKLFRDGSAYLKEHALLEKMDNAAHIVWGTGGSMVPEEEMNMYYQQGASAYK